MEFLGVDIRGLLFLLGLGALVFAGLSATLLLVHRNIATLITAHADILTEGNQGTESRQSEEH